MIFIHSFVIFTSMISCFLFQKKQKKTLQFLFKPLTIILIFLLPLFNFTLAGNRLFVHYIIVGLFFSIIGDILLMLKNRYFIFGLVSFLITHLFYLAGIFSINPFSFSWIVILFVFLWFLFIRQFLSSLSHSLKPAVLIYSLILGILFWQAGELLLNELTTQTILLFIGITLFLISDWMLAEKKFKSSQRFAFINLPVYFTGQWLIAVSTIVN